MFNNMEFNDLFYINPNRIENLYAQLTDGVSNVMIEETNEKTGGLSLNGALLTLFNIGVSSETIQTKKETKQYNKSLESKFMDVISAINEQEYKDIFYIIETYIKDRNNIFAIGKARFMYIYEGK